MSTTTLTSTAITSQRNGVMWERKPTAVGAVHFTANWPNGYMCLHANPRCGNLKYAARVSPKIVDTLWDKDVVSGAANGENDVDWCMKCAVKRVRP